MIKNGNKTDCALIEMIDNWGYSLSLYRPSDRILRTIPFNSDRKMMCTVIINQSSAGYRVFVKGASELVLLLCTKLVGANGVEHTLDP